MIINQGTLSALTTAFKTLFNGAFTSEETYWKLVAMQVPSTTAEQAYAWLGTNTRFREWIGERVIQNLSQHGYTIRNRSWENTIGVDRDAIEDDQYGVYDPQFRQLGQDAAQHPDELVFTLLKAGFATKCYDGQNFFDTDHPVLDAAGNEQSVSNCQPGAGPLWVLLDSRKVLKPLIYQTRKPYKFVSMFDEKDHNVFFQKQYIYGVDARSNVGFGLWQLAFGSKADATPENYAAARLAMQNLKRDRSDASLNISPNIVCCGPALEEAFREILMNERTANGATNTWRGTAELKVVPWLS